MESQRLRLIGKIVLVVGLTGACLFWIIATFTTPAAPSIDDSSAPGYTKRANHQMEVLMGHFGVMMSDWQDTLASPGVEALMIAAATGLFAAYFFRVAWVQDDDERDRLREKKD